METVVFSIFSDIEIETKILSCCCILKDSYKIKKITNQIFNLNWKGGRKYPTQYKIITTCNFWVKYITCYFKQEHTIDIDWIPNIFCTLHQKHNFYFNNLHRFYFKTIYNLHSFSRLCKSMWLEKGSSWIISFSDNCYWLFTFDFSFHYTYLLLKLSREHDHEKFIVR